MPDPRPLVVRKAENREGTRMLLSIPDYDPHILEKCGIDENESAMVSDMLEQYLEHYRPRPDVPDEKPVGFGDAASCSRFRHFSIPVGRLRLGLRL